MARDFFDPVTDKKLTNPEPKTFRVEFRGGSQEGVRTVNTLTEEPSNDFFSDRLNDEGRIDTFGDIDVVGFDRID